MKTISALILVGFSLTALGGAASAKTVKVPHNLYNIIKKAELVGPPVGPGGPKVVIIQQR
jgi:hypothetical protein